MFRLPGAMIGVTTTRKWPFVLNILYSVFIENKNSVFGDLALNLIEDVNPVICLKNKS